MAVIEIKKTNFEQEILHATEPVLIDFFATWCMPCKLLSPIIHEISNEHENLKVCRVDVEMEPELASMFEILSLPTLVYIRDGVIRDKSAGFRSKEAITQMIQQ